MILENPHKNVIDGQCQICGIKEGDTHDFMPIETYNCIPNDWRASPEVPSNLRLFAAALMKLGNLS